uniref:H15 domain-containing protein n=1 Tax=Panagrolaimus sp. PS1159 TaxID=55785 RepID=A0AC35FQC2_9BILA
MVSRSAANAPFRMAPRSAAKQRSSKTKSKSTHPSYAEMIKEAIIDLHNRKGSSRQAILKYMNEHYNIHENFADQTNSHLRQALKHGIENGTLKQSKGIGAAGSFKLADPKTKTADSAKQKDTAESSPSKKHATTSTPKKTTKKAAPKKTKNVKAVPAARITSTLKKTAKKAAPASPKKVKAAPAARRTSTPKKITKKTASTPKKTTKKTANAKGGKKGQAIKKGKVAKK